MLAARASAEVAKAPAAPAGPRTVANAKAMAGKLGIYANPWFAQFAALNIVLGLVAIPLAIGIARRYGARLSTTSAIRHIADSLAGRDIAAAREAIGKLRRFDTDA